MKWACESEWSEHVQVNEVSMCVWMKWACACEWSEHVRVNEVSMCVWMKWACACEWSEHVRVNEVSMCDWMKWACASEWSNTHELVNEVTHARELVASNRKCSGRRHVPKNHRCRRTDLTSLHRNTVIASSAQADPIHGTIYLLLTLGRVIMVSRSTQ